MGVVDEGRMKKEASELFRKLGMTVNLTQPMRNMSVSQRQMCEIAKAISYNSKVIVLDEPTSSLTVQEVEKLFEMMRMLKEQGISLIYISHKMDEIFEICDEISVLRDGNLVMTKSSKETDMNELIAAMVGRSLENRFPPVDNTPKDTILSVQHLSTKFEPHLQDITFYGKKGGKFLERILRMGGPWGRDGRRFSTDSQRASAKRIPLYIFPYIPRAKRRLTE